MSTTHDVMVLGHGLAGAAFVQECQRRGLRAAVVGDSRFGEASRAAAGVVNPVVVRRLLPSWRAQELMPIAQQHYQPALTGGAPEYWHAMPLDTVFPNAAVAAQWKARQHDADLAPFVSQGPIEAPAGNVQAPHGAGRIQACAWLDVRTWLDTLQDELLNQGDWLDASSWPIQRTGDRFHAGACSAPLLVRCEGAFAKLPGLVPVKGETLEVHIPGLALTHMVHRHIFILPLGHDRYRVGATFQWENVWEGPTDEGRRWLLGKLSVLLDPGMMARVEVIDHGAGVRPAARDRRPIMGRIAANEAVINGLGSRGVMFAPWCAQHLVAHLFDGAPLDPDVDITRFGK